MNKKELEREFSKLNVPFDIEKMELLLKDTLETNKKFNLTAITDEGKFRELMIYDSAIPATLLDFDGKKVLDIGTGAGYPGLVLASITRGEFTLLDSTKKKIGHINEFVSLNNIYNVKGVSARAESYVKDHREEFDIVIARAVSSLNILLELALPFVKVGGYFIAMKGSKGEEELNESKNALKVLGAEVVDIHKSELPESKEARVNILIKKTKSANKKFPREYKDIINKPL